ncbi:AAA family ATPase [uncultured Roseovarius sp.]|uniref:AAA family ATPase n=1 Tax=uncultured Roseovarius sp. TaxID=293344 RepID=UPI0025978FCB|nr:AAA family ATPase [uncultured Roseovarius sp.]
MRIKSIGIENFRAIRKLELDGLTDAIVVAGPNGCGKSSIFDAIRLLKSAYGQYHQNEYGQWFSEFNINVRELQTDAERILFDPTKPLKIEAKFELSPSEKKFLSDHAVELYRSLRWSLLLRKRSAEGDVAIADPTTKRADGEIIETQAQALAEKLLASLDSDTYHAELTMKPGDTPAVVGSPVLELVFSLYRPEAIGVIDYHSPSRVYDREQLGNLNLRIRDASDKNAQKALYDTKNKYTGVKAEMAQSYIMEMLAERAGVEFEEKSTLKNTLDELFSNFFPGKRFIGATPTKDGALEFPVQLENGRQHDINELSSGEKEVLLGYLKLRNAAPKHSIILFDEPELHLNPRLSRSLPRFYEKFIGRANSNQIWMVTHSDSILREAVQEPSYCVFHMRPASQVAEGENQIDRVAVGQDVENAVFALVGDLASYSPRSKIVLLEGADTEVDARIVSQLFPDFVDRVNLVSLGSKRTVSGAQDVLEKAAEGGRLDARFFSIVDRDFGGEVLVANERRHTWDRYHIENYLLEPNFIRQALSEISLGQIDLTEEEASRQLRAAAELTIRDIARIRIEAAINSKLVGSISLGFDKGKFALTDGFSLAIERSKEKLDAVVSDLTPETISEMEAAEVDKLRASLDDESWASNFRGRNVLRQFVDMQRGALSYEQLRNLVIARMREADFQPDGMAEVVDRILSA